MNVPQKRKFFSQPEIQRYTSAYFGFDSQAIFFFYVAIAVSAVLPVLVYAYLGSFTRYGADDYCATGQLLQADNFWQASMTRYMEWSGGYSNLLFIQIGEWLGLFGMISMAPALLILWLIGLTWLIAEIGETSGMRWHIGVSFVLAALAIFFSLYRTPSLHKILFWRSSVVGYFAALVLLSYQAAFILHQLRRSLRGSQLITSMLVVFIGVFIIGGTSETVDAFQIGVLLLALFVLYLWKDKVRKEAFLLLGTGVISAVLSMLIMAIAPGNLVRMDVSEMPMPNLFALGIETLTYAVEFTVNNLRVSPLSALFAFFMPLLLFWGLWTSHEASTQWKTRAKWLIIVLPLAMVIVTTFSFAPHAYARSFPSAYVRFPALFLLTLVLITEGCLFGYLLSQVKLPSPAFLRVAIVGLALVVFLYPLRVAGILYNLVPEYRAHAIAWDERDEQIRQAVAAGATDLVVVQLDTMGGVQEYKGNPAFWVNRCAAEYYGLHSLRAP